MQKLCAGILYTLGAAFILFTAWVISTDTSIETLYDHLGPWGTTIALIAIVVFFWSDWKDYD